MSTSTPAPMPPTVPGPAPGMAPYRFRQSCSSMAGGYAGRRRHDRAVRSQLDHRPRKRVPERDRLAAAVRGHPGAGSGWADAGRHASGIDLSLPGMMTLAAMVSSQYAAEHGDNVLAALVIVAVIAIVVGTLNGLAITVFAVTPLVATLAMNAALFGTVLAYSGVRPRALRTLLPTLRSTRRSASRTRCGWRLRW